MRDTNIGRGRILSIRVREPYVSGNVHRASLPRSRMPKATTPSKSAHVTDCMVHLPFDPTQIVENLRLERYVTYLDTKHGRFIDHPLVRKTYYAVRELLPVSIRKHLQKVYLGGWRKLQFPNWPVDFTVDTIHEEVLRLAMEAGGVRRVPFIWFWPQGAPNCLIMTHDVETATGRDFTPNLIDLDHSYGIRPLSR